LFWAFGEGLAVFLGSPLLADWLWLSAVSIWLIGLFNALQLWASRLGRFGGISRAMVGGTLGTVLVQLALGFPRKLLDAGLIVGQAAGRVVQVLQLVLVGKESFRAILAGGGFSGRRLAELLRRYGDFPRYDSGASVLNAVSNELPVLMLGVMFSPTIVGFYAVGRRMLKVPLQLVDNAISRVFFPKASRELQRGRIDRLALTVFAKLAALGIVPMATVTVTAPAIVNVFLGPDWVESTPYIRWLTFWLLIVFVTAPFQQLYNVLERQRARLVYQAGLISVRFTALLVGGLLDNPLMAVALFSIAGAVISMGGCLWLLSQSGLRARLALVRFGRELLYAVPFVAVVGLANWQLDNDLAILAAATAVIGVFAALRYRDILSRAYLATGPDAPT
jgi:O-antigen/teichoic acid export membrane protein